MVDGKPAFIKAGSNFEFNRINNLFESSDGFTFEMEFPLVDCQENIEAFGFLNLPYTDISAELVPCSIQSENIFLKGSIAVMSADRSSVKCQFLEGVDTEESAKKLESVFINELDLGIYPVWNPEEAGKPDGYFLNTSREVCFPWSQVDSEAGNNLFFVDGDKWRWDESTNYLTWFPYLSVIINRIASCIGYDIGKGLIDLYLYSDWGKAIICNCLPQTWKEPEYAKALPNWTVLEFFEKLGKLLKGAFYFNHIDKVIEFVSFDFNLKSKESIVIDRVFDDFTATVSRDESDTAFAPTRKVRYKDSDMEIWKYLCCPDFLKKWVSKNSDLILEYEAWEEALPEIRRFTNYNDYNHRNTFATRLIYIRNIDTYFVMKAEFTKLKAFDYQVAFDDYALFAQMCPINIFGPDHRDYDEEANYEELEFVPVLWQWTDNGQMAVLPAITMDGDDSSADDSGPDWNADFFTHDGDSVLQKHEPSHFYQSRFNQFITHEGSDPSEYYDRIYLGFFYPWHDSVNLGREGFRIAYNNCALPLPDIVPCLQQLPVPDSLPFRLYNTRKNKSDFELDPKVLYEFSFAMDEMPDIYNIFIIKGKRYICRKLSVSFSEKGKSEIIRGEFYRIKE